MCMYLKWNRIQIRLVSSKNTWAEEMIILFSLKCITQLVHVHFSHFFPNFFGWPSFSCWSTKRERIIFLKTAIFQFLDPSILCSSGSFGFKHKRSRRRGRKLSTWTRNCTRRAITWVIQIRSRKERKEGEKTWRFFFVCIQNSSSSPSLHELCYMYVFKYWWFLSCLSSIDPIYFQMEKDFCSLLPLLSPFSLLSPNFWKDSS